MSGSIRDARLSRQIAGEERHGDQDERHCHIHSGICRPDVEEQGRHGIAEDRGANQAQHDADARFPQPLSQDQAGNLFPDAPMALRTPIARVRWETS